MNSLDDFSDSSNNSRRFLTTPPPSGIEVKNLNCQEGLIIDYNDRSDYGSVKNKMTTVNGTRPSDIDIDTIEEPYPGILSSNNYYHQQETRKPQFLIGSPTVNTINCLPNSTLRQEHLNDLSPLLQAEATDESSSPTLNRTHYLGIIKTTMTNGKTSNDQDMDSSNFTKRLPSPILSKSHEVNYEALADGSEAFFDSANHTQSPSSFQQQSTPFNTSSVDGSNDVSHSLGSSSAASNLPFRRNSLLRSSLRRSPQNNSNGETMGHRRVGSFRMPSGTKRSPVIVQTPVSSSSGSSAIAATQLYRSSSFNSSGRSSAGDVEEMYSDGSLEDEVIDLTQKYRHLEEKFSVLAENQSNVDDRYTRSKQENVELSTKLFMVEEQLRDTEQRLEERLREEQRRSKEAISRIEREKELQIANYDIRLQSLQKELDIAKADATRLKGQLDREKSERDHFSDKLYETERELSILRDDNRKLIDEARAERDALALEKIGSQQALIDLKREFESLRKYQMGKHNGISQRDSIDGEVGELNSRLKELDEENRTLKNDNRDLTEAIDDLNAQILNHNLEEGRQLLTLNHFGTGMGNSLAAEFEAMSQDQHVISVSTLRDTPTSLLPSTNELEFLSMKSALKEQKEVNDQLRAYIDNILLSIVENYPQLLEVKNKCSNMPNGVKNGITSINPSEP